VHYTLAMDASSLNARSPGSRRSNMLKNLILAPESNTGPHTVNVDSATIPMRDPNSSMASTKPKRKNSHRPRQARNATPAELARASFGANLLALGHQHNETPVPESHAPSSPSTSPVQLAAGRRKRAFINSGINPVEVGFSRSLLDTAGVSTLPQHFPSHPSERHAFLTSSSLNSIPPIIPKKRKLNVPREVRFAISGSEIMYQRISHPSSALPNHGLMDSSSTTSGLIHNMGPANDHHESGWMPNADLNDSGIDFTYPDQGTHSPARRKRRSNAEIRSATAKRWNEIIPSLAAPYSRLMAETQWGRVPEAAPPRSVCKKVSTCGALKKLAVTCVYGKCGL